MACLGISLYSENQDTYLWIHRARSNHTCTEQTASLTAKSACPDTRHFLSTRGHFAVDSIFISSSWLMIGRGNSVFLLYTPLGKKTVTYRTCTSETGCERARTVTVLANGTRRPSYLSQPDCCWTCIKRYVCMYVHLKQLPCSTFGLLGGVDFSIALGFESRGILCRFGDK